MAKQINMGTRKLQWQIPIINNTKLSRFETEINGEFAYVDYRFYEDDIVLLHTFVPGMARGKVESKTNS